MVENLSVLLRKETEMKKYRQYLATALAMGIMLTQNITAWAAGAKLPSGIEYQELGTKIEEFTAEHKDTTAGMSVSVFGQEEALYTGYFGYADKEAGIAVDKDTVMEWGSATKMLVWVSVMQLWEQEKIDLDTDIREYLPDGFLTNLKYDTPITMLHLMNHTAGFQEVYTDIFIKEQEAILTLGDTLRAHEPEQIYEPGEVTAYSNWGVALAAYIVEQISGKSFDEYVHQYIFEPLGMEHSALSADLSDNAWVQEKRKELQCYTIDGSLIPDCFYYITLYPAGMCTSTLADFEAFGKALLKEDSPLFKKSDTWEMLFSPSACLGDSNVPSNYHGFWVVPYGVETVGHGGNTAGCSSYLLLDLKNKIGVVVMTNQSNETVYNVDMMELIFGEFSEQNYFDAERRGTEGIYRSARTVRVGPFKIMSLSFTDEVDTDEFWAVGKSGVTEKLCFSYGDYVRVPVWQFVLEMVLFILQFAAWLFAIISLLVKMIRKIVCVLRKRKIAIPMGKWSTLSAVMQLLTVLLLAVLIAEATSYALADSYAWVTVGFGLAAAFMAGLMLYGIVMLPKTEASMKRKCYNWASVIWLGVTTVNILYWNLFMFWKM